MANWKPAVKVSGEGSKWCHNALVFATEQEALRSATELMSRWMLVTEAGATETDDPVNYHLTDDGALVAVAPQPKENAA